MYYEKFFGIFNRLRKSNEIERRKRGRDEVSLHSPRSCSIEQLEPRIALTVNDIVIETGGAIDNGWVVLAMDASGDEVYLRATQEIAPTGEVNERVEYADNPSFVSPGSFRHEQAVFQDVLVTNGTQVQYDTLSSGLLNQFGTQPTFSVPDASDPSVTPGNWSVPSNPGAYHIVPGTMVGLLSVTHAGQTDEIFFVPGALHGVDDGGDEHAVDMVFLNNLASDSPATPGVLGPFTVTTLDDEGEPETESVTIQVTGEIDYFGELRFVFTSEDAGDEDEPFTGPDGGSSVNVSYFAPIVPDGPSAVTLASGRDFQLGLQADLPGPDSAIQISSPLVSVSSETSPITNDVVLAATTVQIDSPVTSNGSFLVTPTSKLLSSLLPVGGSRATVVEEFRANTDIQAVDIGVSVGDDTRTTVRERGAAIIGPSGSWESTGGSLSVRAVKADLDFAGKVEAVNQSYLFRTVSEERPYTFRTRDNGELDGSVLDITLDSLDDFSSDDTVIHSVDFKTNANSLRISAEADNFPINSQHSSAFDISIEASSSLNVDAVVTTGAGFNIQGNGDINLNSSIRSLGDVVMSAAGNVTGQAEISTDDGVISISADSVILDGALRVLNPKFDESIDDIAIIASDGVISLAGTLSAANRVSLLQAAEEEPTTAFGVPLEEVDVHEIFANKLFVNAEHDVAIGTDVNEMSVRSGKDVAIEEKGDARFDISAVGETRLTANGVDPDPSTSALRAVVERTENLVVSAPRGSVEVIANSSEELRLGDADSLRLGGGVDTLAAGSVVVRTTQGRVLVLDAPLSGAGELKARVASDLNLDGTFLFNNPGETPSTLTGLVSRNINDDPAFDTIFPGIDGSSLRVRDVVLLTNQTNPSENGLYQITNVGSSSTRWVLTRSPNADITAEMPENTRIAILDGKYERKSFAVTSYGNILGTTPLAARAGRVRSANEIHVRAATDVMLDGIYNQVAGTITSADPTSPLVVSGVTIGLGDLVLVRFGANSDVTADGLHPSAASNGIYTVLDIGDGIDIPWRLQRVDLGNGFVAESLVVVDQGVDRTSITGETYSVSYDGLGLVPLNLSDATVPELQLGSFDPRDDVQFVVTTRGGTNSAPGSLGRMLSLVQANLAEDFNNDLVTQSITFGNALGGVGEPSGTIVLQQELPEIERPFALDASIRYPFVTEAPTSPIVIDGSRITSTRTGTFVTSSSEVNGFVVTAGASGGTKISTPEEAPRSLVDGVSLVGFEQGAAIQIDGASNYLIRNSSIGTVAGNDSETVLYGVQVKAGSGEDGPVTLLNNTIHSASISTGILEEPLEGAGVLIEGGASQGLLAADHVQVIGGDIGAANARNWVGIKVDTEEVGGMGILLGANPIRDVINFSTTQNKSTLALDAETWDLYGKDLFLGQLVSGDGIPVGTEVAFIETGEDRNENGIFEPGEDLNGNKLQDNDLKFITLSNRVQTGNQLTPVSFGFEAAADGRLDGRLNVSNNFRGISLSSGKTRVVNTSVRSNVLDGIEIGVESAPGSAPVLSVTLGESGGEISFNRLVTTLAPESSNIIEFADSMPVYKGMAVVDVDSSPTDRKIPDSTTVVAVDNENNRVTLSSPLDGNLSVGERVSFTGYNPRLRSESSNEILSNGRYGIWFKNSLDTLDGKVVMQGNYVGLEHEALIEPGNLRENYYASNSTLATSPLFDQDIDPITRKLDEESLWRRDYNYSDVETQYDFGDRHNNVNSSADKPLVNTSPPTNLVITPGDRRLTITWVAPVVNDTTYNISGYFYRITPLSGQLPIETEDEDIQNSTALTSRYEIETYAGRNLDANVEYRVEIAAKLVDKNGGGPDGSPFGLSAFSESVSAVPTRPATTPPRRPVTRF